MNQLILYLAGVNLITYILMGMDKQRARKKQYRIPERTFWLLALLGGSLGVLAGMYRFRHKTKHTSFVFGIPILLVVNSVCIIYILFQMS